MALSKLQVRATRGFWWEVIALDGAIEGHVLPNVFLFGAIAAIICLASWFIERQTGMDLGLSVAPHEIAGAVLGLLLVLRTNAGYDRWWEARRLWGGIVNQSRNMVVSALAYGPRDPAWRDEFVRWAAAFPHAARALLRGEPVPPEVTTLLGAAAPTNAEHPPCSIALHLAELLRDARQRHGLDPHSFQQIDRERALLVDHVGGCERILRTPLPLAYAIKTRRFILLFLV